jgi:TPR repeat protein
VSRDEVVAARFLEPAAASGDIDAQSILGQMYLQGEGVPQNYEEAFRLLKNAAEHGNSDAQGFVAVLYLQGDGVSRDVVEAYKWVLLASVASDSAREVRDALASKLTPDQVAEGQRRALEWRPRTRP